jgi:hypothetical protein
VTTHVRRAILAVLFLGTSGVQSLPAQADGWSLGLTGSYSDFRGGARDGTGVTFEPSTRLDIGASAARQFGVWQVEAALSWAPGHLSSRDSTGQVAQLDFLGESFPRVRVAPLIGRRLAAIGEGQLALLLGPTVDLWHQDDQVRSRFGGQARLALQAPLGGLVVQNFVAYSISGSPFNESELPPGVGRENLQAISLGVEIRLRLKAGGQAATERPSAAAVCRLGRQEVAGGRNSW